MGMGAKSWSRGEREALLNRWRMGKGSTKKKPKWKSLELETPPLATTTSTATSATTTPEQGLDPQHPFLKMISKNVDGAVISTERQQQQGASEGSKPIHLYRSSRHLGVPPSAPSSQYVGAPIQYCPTKWVDQQTNQLIPHQEFFYRLLDQKWSTLPWPLLRLSQKSRVRRCTSKWEARRCTNTQWSTRRSNVQRCTSPRVTRVTQSKLE